MGETVLQICEIINVGTELLLGEILNSNAQFLCQQLAAMGISVQRIATVGDNPVRLRADFELALSRSDIILLTGGLGPTKDDLTKEVICETLGLPLIEDAQQMQCIQAFFHKRGIACTESNRKQAMVPTGCTVLYNENGTAPGIWIELPTKAIALLPGPPRELRSMFTKSLAPLLAPRGDGIIVSRHLRTIGLGESRMAELCADFLDHANPTVAPYAKDGEAYLRVSAAAPTKAIAEAMCAEVIESLQNRLGIYAYSVDKALEEVVLSLLHTQGKTLAVAESCTGGGICEMLTALPGASEVFGYGFVTYANEAKESMLNVSHETISRHGAVSAQCAREMAEGARTRSGADIAVAVTGIAGPGSDNTSKPVGLIFLHATDGKNSKHLKLETGRNDRGYNRIAASKQALELIRQLLLPSEGEEA